VTLAVLDAGEIASRVRARQASAREVVDAALARVTALDPKVRAFSEVTAALARRDAERIDKVLASGGDPGPLAGVPFAVKDLYDVAGIVTRSGSKIHAERAPARSSATVVERLMQAGAVLIGTLNMEEYAYGFHTDNPHFGRTLNPHDLTRTAGGSSGGSAAAVAAGLVPLALGSDTNGSIRVPAAFCGVFGLKPTFGRLSRAGTVLFVSSFDHVGPFARSVADLAGAYDAMQGYDPADPLCADIARSETASRLALGIAGLEFGVPGGYFGDLLDEPCRRAVATVAKALGARAVETPDCIDAARAAAFVITSVEAMNERAHELRTRFADFDPKTRYRFLAGALVPGPWYARAQQFRRWFAGEAARWFANVDVMVMPVAPVQAPQFGQADAIIDGRRMPLRLLLGRFVQPLALLGYPIVVAPLASANGLPVAVQLVGRPFEEEKLLRTAAHLERAGVARAAIAKDFVAP
jgi:AtzE family amidohydrolase